VKILLDECLRGAGGRACRPGADRTDFLSLDKRKKIG
jgi:hypothetical protein